MSLLVKEITRSVSSRSTRLGMVRLPDDNVFPLFFAYCIILSGNMATEDYGSQTRGSTFDSLFSVCLIPFSSMIVINIRLLNQYAKGMKIKYHSKFTVHVYYIYSISGYMLFWTSLFSSVRAVCPFRVRRTQLLQAKKKHFGQCISYLHLS